MDNLLLLKISVILQPPYNFMYSQLNLIFFLLFSICIYSTNGIAQIQKSSNDKFSVYANTGIGYTWWNTTLKDVTFTDVNLNVVKIADVKAISKGPTIKFENYYLRHYKKNSIGIGASYEIFFVDSINFKEPKDMLPKKGAFLYSQLYFYNFFISGEHKSIIKDNLTFSPGVQIGYYFINSNYDDFDPSNNINTFFVNLAAKLNFVVSNRINIYVKPQAQFRYNNIDNQQSYLRYSSLFLLNGISINL